MEAIYGELQGPLDYAVALQVIEWMLTVFNSSLSSEEYSELYRRISQVRHLTLSKCVTHCDRYHQSTLNSNFTHAEPLRALLYRMTKLREHMHAEADAMRRSLCEAMELNEQVRCDYALFQGANIFCAVVTKRGPQSASGGIQLLHLGQESGRSKLNLSGYSSMT